MKSKKENRLVVSSGGWADTLPNWLLDEIRHERIMLGIISTAATLTTIEKVGDAEVLAFLMTASLAAPPSRNHTEIYCYLATHLMQKQGKTIPADIRKTELSADQQRDLDKLKSMIYDKRGGDIHHPIFELLQTLRKGLCSKENGQGLLFEANR